MLLNFKPIYVAITSILSSPSQEHTLKPVKMCLCTWLPGWKSTNSRRTLLEINLMRIKKSPCSWLRKPEQGSNFPIRTKYEHCLKAQIWWEGNDTARCKNKFTNVAIHTVFPTTLNKSTWQGDSSHWMRGWALQAFIQPCIKANPGHHASQLGRLDPLKRPVRAVHPQPKWAAMGC